MKKKSLVCGLVPALTLGMCLTGFAAPATESDVQTADVQAADVQAADVQTIQELRAQLEADLKQAQEMEERLNAQLDSLDKRVTKVEQGAANPRIEIHGSVRLRHEKHNFGVTNHAIDQNTIRLNLLADYHISDGWTIKSESEFENNLTHNAGAYEGDAGYDYDGEYYKRGGKRYSREMKQLYVDGKIGNFELKLGRYTLQSPYKFTYNDGVDGIQVKYGFPMKWGKANVTLSAGNTGNTYDGSNIGLDDPTSGREWDAVMSMDDKYLTRYKIWSLMAEVPVAKDTNVVTHYANVKHRDATKFSRNTFAIGFDTKIAPNVKLTAATAKSDADKENRAHMFELRYRETDTAKPGTYSIFLKKYLLNSHASLDRMFIDDISVPQNFQNQYEKEYGEYNLWKYRFGGFNGLRIGAEYVPFKNSLFKLEYTFGDLRTSSNADNPPKSGSNHSYSFLSAQLQFFF